MEICFCIAFPIFWAVLWIKTFKTVTIKSFIIHSIIFLLLSLLVCCLFLRLIFLSVDDTYSASNLGALGILYLSFLYLFIPGCLISLMVTLGKLLIKMNKKGNDK